MRLENKKNSKFRQILSWNQNINKNLSADWSIIILEFTRENNQKKIGLKIKIEITY